MSGPHLIHPQLLDRGIEMSRGNTRAHSIKRRQLFFKCCKYVVHAAVAGRRGSMIFQVQIPITVIAVLTRATSGRQQKLVGYRVNTLRKSTEENYVVRKRVKLAHL